MLNIEKNKPLAPYTTLKIGAAAEFFAAIKSKEDLLEAIAWARKNKKPIWILGGGSNVLISKKIKGLVLKNEIRGMDIIKKNKDYAFVEAKSGESWTKFVNFTVEQGLSGLENLFLIYGTVGAAPVQNIGAYGVELKDVFYHLRAIDLRTGHEKIFALKDCRFGYRDSVFKNRLKGKYFIYSITVKLKRQPNFKLDYGSIREVLAIKGIKKPTARQLISVIQEIRNSKLPNPGLFPNAGSFFKNIEISTVKFKNIKAKYPDVPSWPTGPGKVKVPAAWLIEQAGFKGKKIGPVGMHEKQALILVNYQGAKAQQVLALMKKVKGTVKRKFGLDLEEEVNVI
ncbi:MAG: UDP-N-acetylmuramate dehydrogenase [Patescibacteria group bacterium]|jgi:UDP-N-acetylmuramate dehydrogenase